jgi:hypothetical protein
MLFVVKWRLEANEALEEESLIEKRETVRQH